MILLPLFISRERGVSMWIRNEDRNGQKILDEVEIDGVLWVEIQEEKGVEDVQSEDRGKPDKKVVSSQDVLCQLGNK
jgi:hypothetical protein